MQPTIEQFKNQSSILYPHQLQEMKNNRKPNLQNNQGVDPSETLNLSTDTDYLSLHEDQTNNASLGLNTFINTTVKQVIIPNMIGKINQLRPNNTNT